MDMDRIVVDSTVHFGKPCVVGTRITVRGVLELVDQDLPFNRIIQDYFPDLTAADIHACIRYAGTTSFAPLISASREPRTKNCSR